MFGPYMSEGGTQRLRDEMSSAVTLEAISEIDSEVLVKDAEMDNLEGGGALDKLNMLIGVWATVPGAMNRESTAGSLIHRMHKYLHSAWIPVHFAHTSPDLPL